MIKIETTYICDKCSKVSTKIESKSVRSLDYLCKVYDLEKEGWIIGESVLCPICTAKIR